MQTKNELLDLGFMDARIHLLELAAFLDRIDRTDGQADGRLEHMKKVLPLLLNENGSGKRVNDILNALSYQGEEPVTDPVGPRACGVPL